MTGIDTVRNFIGEKPIAVADFDKEGKRTWLAGKEVRDNNHGVYAIIAKDDKGTIKFGSINGGKRTIANRVTDYNNGMKSYASSTEEFIFSLIKKHRGARLLFFPLKMRSIKQGKIVCKASISEQVQNACITKYEKKYGKKPEGNKVLF